MPSIRAGTRCQGRAPLDGLAQLEAGLGSVERDHASPAKVRVSNEATSEAQRWTRTASRGTREGRGDNPGVSTSHESIDVSILGP